jgi:hypothetical protein
LFEEKNVVEKRYTGLLGDVKNFMDTTAEHVVEQNMDRLKKM